MVTLAQDVIVQTEAHGHEAMVEAIAKRRGGAYEPELADLFLADAERFLAGIEGTVDRETILALEPVPHAMFDEAACEEAFLAIADMIDMRMPFTFGHSRAVAALADAAGTLHGPSRLRTFARSAGQATPMTSASSRFRSRPGCGRRALRPRDRRRPASSLPWRACAAAFGADGTPVAALVLRHHERLDGSGYHRYARGADLSPAARILAAAEAFQTAREEAAAPAGARAMRRRRRSCDAVREGSSARKRPRPCSPPPVNPRGVKRCRARRGLTPREIEVLRLIAAGHTAKEAARTLEIAPKTADNHIQNLYSKIGVTTRAAAALYALERGLVEKERIAA